MRTPEARPVALVTGAAVRVGAAIARRLDAEGYRVWLHHHASGEAAGRLQTELDHAVATPHADLRDPAQRAALIDHVTDPEGPAGGRLDLLVNNAASFERGPFLERTDADLARVLELVLVAPLSLARRAHPALTARSGCIVQIGDLLARHPSLGHLDHGVAKAALEAATRALSLELAPVRVCAVVPGTVAWPEGTPEAVRAQIRSQTALGRIATPEDVADAVVFLAGATGVTGEALLVDAGQSAGAGRRPT
ncbi:MAG: SDR family oxidoreductase [Myxococcota bacterium]